MGLACSDTPDGLVSSPGGWLYRPPCRLPGWAKSTREFEPTPARNARTGSIPPSIGSSPPTLWGSAGLIVGMQGKAGLSAGEAAPIPWPPQDPPNPTVQLAKAARPFESIDQTYREHGTRTPPGLCSTRGVEPSGTQMAW